MFTVENLENTEYTKQKKKRKATYNSTLSDNHYMAVTGILVFVFVFLSLITCFALSPKLKVGTKLQEQFCIIHFNLNIIQWTLSCKIASHDAASLCIEYPIWNVPVVLEIFS